MRPRVHDDGRELTIDLHGASLRDAEAYIRRASRLAYERGRNTLRIIHGSSTSDLLYRNQTIRHMLHDMLDAGDLQEYVAGDWREEGHCLLNIRVSRNNSPARITAPEVTG